jgi:hypothetical protein
MPIDLTNWQPYLYCPDPSIQGGLFIGSVAPGGELLDSTVDNHPAIGNFNQATNQIWFLFFTPPASSPGLGKITRFDGAVWTVQAFETNILMAGTVEVLGIPWVHLPVPIHPPGAPAPPAPPPSPQPAPLPSSVISSTWWFATTFGPPIA